MPLTDTAIKNLRPNGTRYRKADGGGLFLEVAPTGAKVWRLAYRHGGKQRTLVVGPYPSVTLAKARFHREVAKEALRAGEDPAAAKDAEAPVEIIEADPKDPALWGNLIDAYLEKRRREAPAERTMTRLTRQANATRALLGEKRADEITAQDIIAVCRPYEVKNLLHTAQGVRTTCGMIFRFAIAQGLAKYDPATPARDAIARPVSAGYAGITDPDRFGALMRAIRVYEGDPVTRAGLLLSAYLFPRNGELREMRWSQIDFEDAIWTVPAEQMKKKREHLVPLPRQALEILEGLKPFTARFERVLHSMQSHSGLLSENTFNKALRKMGFMPSEHVHHGFRTSASTFLNERGWNHDWIERQLAHVEENKVRGAYNKALYLPGRREMMAAYADLIDGFERGGGTRATEEPPRSGPAEAGDLAT